MIKKAMLFRFYILLLISILTCFKTFNNTTFISSYPSSLDDYFTQGYNYLRSIRQNRIYHYCYQNCTETKIAAQNDQPKEEDKDFIFSRKQEESFKQKNENQEKEWDTGLKKFSIQDNTYDSLKYPNDPTDNNDNHRKRIIAAQRTAKDNKLFFKSYNLCSSTRLTINLEKFKNFHGNHLQQQIHSELVAVLNEAIELDNKYIIKDPTETIIIFADMAHHFNQANKIKEASALSDICQNWLSIIKDVINSVASNIQLIYQTLRHPIQTFKSLCSGIGKLYSKTVLMTAKIISNPPSDEIFQREFSNLCTQLCEKFKKTSTDQIYEKIGSITTDVLLSRFVAAKSTGMLTSFKASQFYKQVSKVVGLSFKKGKEKVRNAINFILNGKNFFSGHELLQNTTVKKENFLKRIINRAINYSKARGYYTNQVINNYEWFKSNPIFRQQLQDLKLSFHYISPEKHISFVVLKDGTKILTDKAGRIWKFYPEGHILHSNDWIVEFTDSIRRKTGSFIESNHNKFYRIKSKDLEQAFAQKVNFIEEFKIYKANSLKENLDWSLTKKNGETRIKHINKHGLNNLQKPKHNIFYGDPIKVTNKAWSKRGKIKPITENNIDIYHIPYDNAGYTAGYAQQRQNLNYVTIVIESNTNKLITSFPSFGN